MNTVYEMLLEQCEAVATSVSLPFKVPNAIMDNTPAKWIEFVIIPNGEAKAGWQDLKADQGILRALVYWPPGDGWERPGAVCDIIADYFKQGTRWHSDPAGTVVEIYAPPTISAAVEDGQSTFFPVSMRYRAFTG